MTSLEHIAALLISEDAEEVKQLTIGIRKQYQGCRVEAVYTTDQATEWASMESWHLIIVDLEFPGTAGFTLVKKLRQQAPQAGIILHSASSRVSPLQAMRSGATALLHRQAPAFLDDLLAISHELLQRAASSSVLDDEPTQYLTLIESRGPILYELNSDGQFTYVSSAVRSLLGYDAKELLGQHYSNLLHSESRRLAEQRFNERRAGARATHKLELRLLPKSRIGLVPDRLEAHVSARGVYASPRKFLGTLGLIHKQPRGPAEQSGKERSLSIASLPQDSSSPQFLAAALESIWQTVEHFLGNLDVVPHASHIIRPSPDLARRQPTSEVHSAPLSTRAAIPSSVPASFPEKRSSQSLETFFPSTVAHPGESPAHQETRRTLHLQTEISLAGEIWNGITTNVSRTGLYVLLPHGPLTVTSQTVTVSLISDVLFLQLTGRAAIDKGDVGTILRVQFSEMEEVKRTVLLSFLEVLRDHPESLKVQINFLSVPPSTAHPILALDPPRTLHATREHRFDLRIPCQIPVQLVYQTPHGVQMRFSCTLLDVHLRGARIRTNENVPTHFGTCNLELRHPSSTQMPMEISTKSTRVPFCHVPIRIVRDVVRIADARSRAALTWNYGVQFGATDDQADAALGELVNHAILSFMGTATYRTGRTVVTDLLFTHNSHDRRIALYHDYAQHDDPGLTPVVVIAPDLGHTKEQYIALAYFLAAQGFHVLRYDLTNHIGESDGYSIHTLLSSMQLDLSAVLAFVSEFWPGTPALLVGHGVGGRICARVIKEDWWMVGLVFINVPLDHSDDLHALQHTRQDPLKALDPIHTWGHFRGIKVSTEGFVQDAVTSRYVSSQDLLQDLTGITIPVSIFAALEDVDWQQGLHEQIKTILGQACSAINFEPDSEIRHLRISSPPGNWVQELARFCMAQARHGHLGPSLNPAPESDLIQEQRLEQQRIQGLRRWTRADRIDHWSSYVKLGQSITQSSAYRGALESLAQPLMSLGGQHRILDLGCGDGELAAFLVTQRSYRHQRAGISPFQVPEYIGIDVSPESLAHARARILALQSTLSREGFHALFGGRTLVPLLSQGSVDGPLPFVSSRFDAVVVSLLLGHTTNPLLIIEECFRVLAVGGRLLCMTLKPEADLPLWYHRSILHQEGLTAATHDTESLEQALNDFQLGYLEGSLYRFSHQNLVALLTHAKATVVSIESGLNNQAFITVAQKS